MEEKSENEVLDPEEEENFVIPNTYSPFRQQKVPACKPFLTPFLAGCLYALFGTICIILGVIYQVTVDELKELPIDYTDDALNTVITKEFTVDQNFKKDLYVYYEIDNLYQNYQAYLYSKSWDQLKGVSRKKADLEKCKPMEKDGKVPYAPCGSIAASMFNDTFAFDGVEINEKDISSKYFKDIIKPLSADDWNKENSVLVLNEAQFPGNTSNEHFINWLQISPTSSIRKLYGKLTKVLPNGKYTVRIANNYPVKPFDGKKRIVIAEVSSLGCKNRFFPIFFLVVGGLSWICGIVFFILHFMKALPLYKNMFAEMQTEELTMSLNE